MNPWQRFKSIFSLHGQPVIPEEPPTGETAWSEIQGLFGNAKQFVKFREDDLIQRKGHDVYLDMLNDDQVIAGLELMAAAVEGRTWRFDVETPEQQEMADVLTYNLERTLQGTMRQLVDAMLTARNEGFSLVEKIFGTFEFEGKEWWGLESYKLRPAHSFEFEVDIFGNILHLLQDQEMQQKKLDIRRFIYTVHNPNVDPIYGRSALFPVYQHWWSKKNLYAYWNIFAERAGAGFLVASTEGSMTVEQKTNLRNVLTNFKTNTAIHAPKGVVFEYHWPKDEGVFNKAITARNMAIMRALLVPSLMGFGEETGTGSNARAEVQFNAWMMILDRVAEGIADILNEQLFRELSQWNFGTLDFPLFKFDSLTQKQREGFAEQWITAVEKGVVVNTFEDELHLRDTLKFPAREEDAEGITEAPVEEEEEPIVVPDGENPIDSATSGMQSALDPFPDRVDTAKVADQVFGVQAQAMGRTLRDGLEEIFFSVIEALPGDMELSDVPNINANPDQVARWEQAIKVHLEGVFVSGQKEAMTTLERTREEKNEFKLKAPPVVVLSAMGKEFLRQAFGMDAVTAEEFLNIKILDMVGHPVNDSLIQAIRRAMTDGLINDLSLETVVQNALIELAPLLGEFDANGNRIDPATLPARVRTIVNTATTQAFNEGMRSFYEDPDLEGFVQAYEYVAVLDTRTTEFCRIADGRTWVVDSLEWQRYLPPNHFNCRSIIKPITQGDEWSQSKDMPVSEKTGEQIQPNPGF